MAILRLNSCWGQTAPFKLHLEECLTVNSHWLGLSRRETLAQRALRNPPRIPRPPQCAPGGLRALWSRSSASWEEARALEPQALLVLGVHTAGALDIELRAGQGRPSLGDAWGAGVTVPPLFVLPSPFPQSFPVVLPLPPALKLPLLAVSRNSTGDPLFSQAGRIGTGGPGQLSLSQAH